MYIWSKKTKDQMDCVDEWWKEKRKRREQMNPTKTGRHPGINEEEEEEEEEGNKS
jgi:hypothetical protein